MKILIVQSMQKEYLNEKEPHFVQRCAKKIREEIENGTIVVAVKDISGKNSEFDPVILQALKNADKDKRYSMEKMKFGAVLLPPLLWDIITVWGVPEEISIMSANCDTDLAATAFIVQSEFREIPFSVFENCCMGSKTYITDTALLSLYYAGIKLK